MKSTVLLALLALGITLAYSRIISPRLIGHNSPELNVLRQRLPNEKLEKFDHFVEFMKKHDKQYKSLGEVHHRFGIFLDNLQRLAKSQAHERGTAKHGVTRFFDLTLQEFRQKFTGLKLTHPKRKFGQHDLTSAELLKYQKFDAPQEVDWRKDGAVTDAKDQGQCGSCFAFGTVGAIEGQWFKKTGNLISFSEEEILDCGDEQCDGGDPLHVYDTVAEIGGLETEDDYPYVADWGEVGDCSSDPKKFTAYVNGSRAFPTGDEDLLGKILASEGPIEINIDADWLFDYDSGILNPDDQDPGAHPELINHAVLLVGYGEENGTKYWIVKNSWSKYFGENGYFRVARGTDRLYLVDTNPSLPLII